MEKMHYFSLEKSEMAIFRAAADIFAGYVAKGAVTDATETEYLKKAIKQAIILARQIDVMIESDDEGEKK